MRTCTACGAEAQPEARFCAACGAPVATTDSMEERKLVTLLSVNLRKSMTQV